MEKRTVIPGAIVSSVLLAAAVLVRLTGLSTGAAAWWLTGWSIAVAVGTVVGLGGRSRDWSGGFWGVFWTLLAFAPVRLAVRTLMGRPVDIAHSAELFAFTASSALIMVVARAVVLRTSR